MGKKELVFILYLLSSFALLIGIQRVESSTQHLQKNGVSSKLFVFGDSYADTGNIGKSVSSSWKLPYGITFPGKPAGRFSDGRILTDYVASFMGIKSPIAYRLRKTGRNALRYGMNFAYGGTGVFQTPVPEPNMSTQILFFRRVILHDRLYTQADLASSFALVSLAGNDYGAFTARNDSAQGLRDFIPTVVNQLAMNLKSIHDMGVKKIAVTSLEPLGCLPQSTVSFSYQQCNGSQNMAVNLHNVLLQQAVAKLNNETKGSTFHILDLYDAFLSTFRRQGRHSAGSILKPCCMSVRGFSCGSMDEKGVKQYTVCRTLILHSFGTMFILHRQVGVLSIQLWNLLYTKFSGLGTECREPGVNIKPRSYDEGKGAVRSQPYILGASTDVHLKACNARTDAQCSRPYCRRAQPHFDMQIKI